MISVLGPVFVTLLVVDSRLPGLVALLLWVLSLIEASECDRYELPIAGDVAADLS